MEKDLGVLIVDDNGVFAEALVQFLRRKEGVRIVGRASDGLEGVAQAEERMPDLILMDVHLPNLNGIEAARQLQERKNPATIVMMTSHGPEVMNVARVAAGVELAINKSDILDRMDSVLTEVRERLGQTAPVLDEVGPRSTALFDLLDSALDPFLVHDGKFVVWANAAAGRLWSAENAELLAGRSMDNLFVGPFGAPEDGSPAQPPRSPSQPMPVRIRIPSNRGGIDVEKDVELLSVPLRISRGRFSICRIREPETRAYSAEQLERLYRVRLAANIAIGFAHDMNNPLTCITFENETIRTRLQRLTSALESQRDKETFQPLVQLVAECRSSIAAADASTTVMSGLVREFFRVSNGDETDGEKRPIDLRKIAQDAMRLTAVRTRRRAQTELSVSGEAQIIGRDGPLTSALVNLLTNAADAFPSGEQTGNRIKVRVHSTPSQVFCDVSDNGSGIPPGILPKLFEAFATSKRVGEGTGLGLATARRTVRDMGGDLMLLETGSSGTTFRMVLPRVL